MNFKNIILEKFTSAFAYDWWRKQVFLWRKHNLFVKYYYFDIAHTFI